MLRTVRTSFTVVSDLPTALLAAVVAGTAPAFAVSGRALPPRPVSGPASLVNPLIGMGSGGQISGDVNTFPGAGDPFGMLQWSPDTSPDRTDGGGYFYSDAHPPHRPVSTTTEYNTDDFSIGAFASALGDTQLATQMMTRAQDWENLYNPATGFMQSREKDGQFLSPLDPSNGGSKYGFAEGNAYQYTQMVPFNLAGLVSAEGGNQAFAKRLDAFFTNLNAGKNAPYDWAGDEPNLGTPWEYDYSGAPYRTQAVVREIMTTLYADTPPDGRGRVTLTIGAGAGTSPGSYGICLGLTAPGGNVPDQNLTVRVS